MARPRVSVIVTSYNPGAYLRPSLQSVLDQTFSDLEIILIDDGSTDDSLELAKDQLKDPRVRLLKQENRGRSAALNRALDTARGEFYAIQDADDISHPSRIERLVAMMDREPDLGGVMSGNDLIIHADTLAPRCRTKDRHECWRDIDQFVMPAHDPTGMYRMALVGDMRYETSLPYVEAFDYTLRVGERYPMVVLGECLYSYRIHPRSITRRSPLDRDRMVIEVLRRACERRGTTYERVFGTMHQRRGERVRNRDCDNNLAAHFIESVVDLRAQGRRLEAIRTGLACSRIHTTDPHYLKALAYAVLPSSVVQKVRTIKQESQPRCPLRPWDLRRIA